MFHLKKTHLHRRSKKNIVVPGSNPFDSDQESNKKTHQPFSHIASSEPILIHGQDSRIKLFEDSGNKVKPSSHTVLWSAKSRYKNDFTNSGGLENQSVQELENYAEYKAEETTKTVNSCLKIAENMRDDATKTLVALHHQGEQINRTHAAAANIDYDLSRGEKLLGSLGGFFSKKWKPTKTRKISGPIATEDENKGRGVHLKQHEKLGLNNASKGKTNARTTYPEPNDVYQKVEVERAKQDDALSGLSNILDELKDMAIGMRSELDRGLDPIINDVDELNFRLKGANKRGRHILGK
ncbi:SNAP25 homologous protein SNAP33-like [Impatiens glandulifera]|uniref:SNAP25 homologous protein SNAP33-like n=1 Tax=Impatiens glandulifera TaxID=253017 RepID=UPI001FB0B309|nr:SNAP25 homologous protein SNAP33-like [Impatiens glandulifera]